MSWYSKMRQKCVGNGEWASCLEAVHARRDYVYAKALNALQSRGHEIGGWTPMGSARCLKCGMTAFTANIYSETSAPDFFGAVFINDCPVNLEGGYTEYREPPPTHIRVL